MNLKPFHPILLVVLFFFVEVVVVSGMVCLILLIMFGVLTGCQNLGEVFSLLFN